MKNIGILSVALASTVIHLASAGPIKRALPSPTDRFKQLFAKVKASSNGYFSSKGIPYHSVETLICEAPDYGHETTSEAFSYWIWIEAVNGKLTGDWSGLNAAWTTMETYLIPSQADQPTNSGYQPNSPASLALESDDITQYPEPFLQDPVGSDPIYNDLTSTYGTSSIYGTHWILDVDNWYGFGHCGDGTTSPSYFNTFQRGASESVWKTVPQPSCETFTWGRNDGTGFGTLFTGGSASKQWKYTNAPDADSRSIQAIWWANKWATEQGKAADVSGLVTKASKLGDYLRYAFFDKYFKQMNCQDPSCAGGSGYNSAHYLLSWYYAWGGAEPSSGSWAWRISSSHAHFGYQNPLAAWVLSNDAAFKPKSSSGASDWATSLDRQLEFYQWLQTAEGAIAGGATNMYKGQYAKYPSGAATFYGMIYDWQPVYHDPPSNSWFGFQAWSMERVAEYYYVTEDSRAATLLAKWVKWAMSVTTLTADGSFKIPGSLNWTGQPDTWVPTSPGANKNLHVVVVDQTGSPDIGVAAAYAKTLMYYAAKTADTAAQTLAKELIDRTWTLYSDNIGVSAPETRADFNKFNNTVYIPSGWVGKMPSGDVISSSSTFLSLRSKYTQDPQWSKVQAYLNGGAVPTFHYHRLWAQADIMLANFVYDDLFGVSSTTVAPTTTKATTSVKSTTKAVTSVKPTTTKAVTSVKPTTTKAVTSVKSTTKPVTSVKPTTKPVTSVKSTTKPTTSVKPTTKPVTSVKPTTISKPTTTQKPHTTATPSGNCASKWGQCGGMSWSGPTCCQAGSICTLQNPYYSQCL